MRAHANRSKVLRTLASLPPQGVEDESELTEWFMRRFGQGKRVRRIGIVGVARRLAVALWRFHTTGELPKGAKTKRTTVKSKRTAVERGAAKSRETVAKKVPASAA